MCRFTKHFALLIAMLLASIQYGLSATSYDYEEEIDGVTAYFTFNSEDRTLNLVGVSDKNIESFDVPSKTSNGLKVISIGRNAFSDCRSLTSVVIPNSVTSIDYCAFYYCFGLTSVDIPNSVTNIGDLSFYNTGLTSVDIPSSVTSIGDEAFSGCTSLTSVDISNGVTSTGEATFKGCTSLTSVDIPSSVTNIGYRSFYNTGLTSIIIPNSVTNIGGNNGGNTFGDNLKSVKMYSETPIIFSGSNYAFGEQNIMFVLYVPVGTKDKYRNYYAYKNYYIEEFDPEEDPFDSNNDVKTIVADEYDGVIDVYNMYGVKVLSTYKKDEIDNLQKAIYVVKVGQKTDKYIVK